MGLARQAIISSGSLGHASRPLPEAMLRTVGHDEVDLAGDLIVGQRWQVGEGLEELHAGGKERALSSRRAQHAVPAIAT